MKKLVLASLLALGLGSAMVYANQAATELEHQNKTASGVDSVAGDMSAMKAAGKCNADQSSKKTVPKKDRAKIKSELEIEHANKLSELEIEHANKLQDGSDGVAGDMGNMKAQGKCGSN